ncbi:MAG: hypothetical protein MUP11_00395 [Anaerolineales bacterium]|nr:hypothetical protein [Anaerolineales bacterium]
MNNEELKADVIEVGVSGTFKTEHVFATSAGILGILTLNAGISEGDFQGADGSSLVIKRTSFWKSNYELRDGNSVIATAVPLGKLRRGLILNMEGEPLGLYPGGSKLRSWRIKDALDQVLCEILPRGAFKRGAYLRINAQIPLRWLVFGYCLVTKRWQEESS